MFNPVVDQDKRKYRYKSDQSDAYTTASFLVYYKQYRPSHATDFHRRTLQHLPRVNLATMLIFMAVNGLALAHRNF